MQSVRRFFAKIARWLRPEPTEKKLPEPIETLAKSEPMGSKNHKIRIAEYCYLLAIKTGLTEEEAELIRQAAPYYDIGKTGINGAILNKPGRLSPQEFAVVKDHVQIGYELLKDSGHKVLQAAAAMARDHHEKYDGTGYPRGLEGEQIHLYGRIAAIADVFDAMGFDRVYQNASPTEEILAYFRDQQGKHFDPMLVEVFLDSIDEFLQIREQYKDAA